MPATLPKADDATAFASFWAATDRADAINEAIYDAACDGDGRPKPNALERHLGKRGMIIVDAAEYHRMHTTLMMIGSCGDDGDSSTALALATKAARSAFPANATGV